MQTRKRLPLQLVTFENADTGATAKVLPFGRRATDRVGGSSIERPGVSATKKFEAVFECVSEALVTIGRNGEIELANAAVEELTGYLRDELIGEPLSKLAPREGKCPSRTRPLERSIVESEGTHEDVAIERKDGYPRVVDLSVRVVKDPGGDFSVVMFRDVTEKKRMERELITKHSELRNAFVELEKKNSELKATQETLVQAGKMAALGELAAGIAHELNQPLMAIRGYAQELDYSIPEEVRQASAVALGRPTIAGEISLGLKEIISASDKMAQIISHLRTFTRKSTEDFEVVDVRQPVDEALKMVARQLNSRGITVEKNYGPTPLEVYANPLQLEQVFINLTTNARDAIEATGRGRGTISIGIERDGAFIEIRFRDDGIGMGEGITTKAFNPFFTTKEVGKGMGLGLSLSYGILSKVQGSIRIESEEGRGTTFIIRLPRDFRELV
jgi:PAS domain S-box-containing protein